jgi:hypothetical protein
MEYYPRPADAERVVQPMPGRGFSLSLKIDGEAGYMDADGFLSRQSLPRGESASRTNKSVLYRGKSSILCRIAS